VDERTIYKCQINNINIIKKKRNFIKRTKFPYFLIIILVAITVISFFASQDIIAGQLYKISYYTGQSAGGVTRPPTQQPFEEIICGNDFCDLGEMDYSNQKFCPLDCPGVPIKVTSTIFNERDPKISGNKIVWIGDESGDDELYLYNLATRKKTYVGYIGDRKPFDTLKHSLEGNNLAWQRKISPFENEVVYKNLKTGEEHVIAEPTPGHFSPSQPHSVDTKIIYRDISPGEGYRYFYYDIPTKTNHKVPIPESIYTSKTFRIAPDKEEIAIYSDTESINEYHLFNFMTGQTDLLFQITEEVNHNIDFSDRKLTYSYDENGKGYVYDINTNTHQYVENSGYSQINNNNLMWIETPCLGSNDVYIFHHSLLEGKTAEISKLLTSKNGFGDPIYGYSIGEKGIVWGDNGKIKDPSFDCTQFTNYNDCIAYEEKCKWAGTKCLNLLQSDIYFYGFGTSCGNGVCEDGENKNNCPEDCSNTQASLTLDGISQITNTNPEISKMTNPEAIFVSGDYAYVTSHYMLNKGSLSVIDISDPYNPDGIGQVTENDPEISTMSKPSSVFVSGDYAYVVNSNGNSLTIIDISDSYNPDGISQITKDDDLDISTMHYPNSVFVSGNHAFITSFYGYSLAVIDISDPYNPDGIGQVTNTDPEIEDIGNPTSVHVSGDYAYITGTGHALAVIDISDPYNPDGVGQVTVIDMDIKNMDYPSSVFFSDNYVYVTGDNGNSLSVIDVSNPTSPDGIAQITKDDDPDIGKMENPESVYLSGDYAFVVNTFPSNSVTVVKIIK